MNVGPRIAALTTKGISLLDGTPPFNEHSFRGEDTAIIRSILFSSKGNYFAYRNDKRTGLVQCSDWSEIASYPAANKEFGFSPLDNYFMTWEVMFTKDNVPGKPNLRVYRSATGELITSFSQRSHVEWEIQWSADEKICAWKEGARVLIYMDGQLDRYTHQINADKFKNFSLAPSVAPAFYFATFSLGKNGQPSVWKIWNHPEYTNAVANKSSYQTDCKFYWNRRGTDVLALMSTDIDKTGGSYYGKQALFIGDVKGNAAGVTFSKVGPIHAVAWSPGNWNEWAAVYGHMPAQATVFNVKCEPLFEFGTGSWNTIYYSPDGSRLLFGGFGNIASGYVEVWDPRGFKKQGTFSAPATTLLQWDPRSECVLTASTFPRLTVSNGYKVWHYTGALLKKRMLDNDNLYSICWQPGSFPKSELSSTTPKGIEDDTPKASALAYRPPSARATPKLTSSLHEKVAPHKPGEAPSVGPSKQALKQKEKREKAKAKKAEERAQAGAVPESPSRAAPSATRPTFQSTGDPDKDKKIKNLQKKLSDIAKLKEAKASGKQLELNQQAKLDSEAAILKEMEQLKL